MAPLDLDPYWEYGSGSGTVKMSSKEVKKMHRFQVEDSIDFFLLKPNGFYLNLGVLNQGLYSNL